MQKAFHHVLLNFAVNWVNQAYTNTSSYLAPIAKKQGRYRILAFNWRCLEHPQAGGAEINLFRQAKYWVAMGHHVTVFAAHPGQQSTTPRAEYVDGIRVLRFGGRFTLYIMALFYALFFSWQYDVILDISNGIPFFMPLVTRKPVTLMIHHVHRDQWHEEFSPTVGKFGWFLESRVVPFLYRNKQVITVSPTTEEEMLKIGYDPLKISIIYNGIDSSTPPFREMRDKPQVTYIGRIKAYKRLDKLLRAVWVLRQEFTDIRLDIAGIGDYSDELERLISKYGMEDCVTVHGHVTDAEKAQLFSKTRIFANPSMQEGWGISVIEANAYGCPAVAYNVPGLSASIINNETGLLANDDDEFVECIARLLRDDVLLERLSHGAVYWGTMFDWRSAALSTLSVMTCE